MNWQIWLLRNRIRRICRRQGLLLRLWLVGMLDSVGRIHERKPISMLRIKIIRVNGKKVVKTK